MVSSLSTARHAWPLASHISRASSETVGELDVQLAALRAGIERGSGRQDSKTIQGPTVPLA